MTYFNTTNESGTVLKDYQNKSLKQDDIVLSLCYKHKTFTASKIFSQFPTFAPITSIRRSLNTLLNKSLIVSTGKKTKGMYGRNETEYKLKNN